MNKLNINIKNKHVILSKKYYNWDLKDRVFYCFGGFGCSPTTIGKAVFGIQESTGNKFRAEGFQIERIAKESEIEKSKHREI